MPKRIEVSVHCGAFSLLFEPICRCKTIFQLHLPECLWEVCALVAGVLGRKGAPTHPGREKTRSTCAGHRPWGVGQAGLQVMLQGLLHSTLGMSARPKWAVPAGLEAALQTRTAQRFWLPVCKAGAPSWHVPWVQVQGPRTHSHLLRWWWPIPWMAFVPGVGLGLPPGLLQRRKWVSSIVWHLPKPSVQPQALELGGICTDKVSPQFPFAFDINQPAGTHRNTLVPGGWYMSLQ